MGARIVFVQLGERLPEERACCGRRLRCLGLDAGLGEQLAHGGRLGERCGRGRAGSHVLQLAEVGPGDRIVLRALQRRARQRQEGAGIGRRDVAALGPALLPLGAGILEQQLLAAEGGVQLPGAPHLVVGGGRAAAQDHPQQLRVALVEGQQRGQHRVPSPLGTRHHQVLVQLLAGLRLDERVEQVGLAWVGGPRREDRDVEHPHEPRDGEDQEVLGQLGQTIGDEGLPAFQQHFEPHHEARGVEGLVFARSRAPPQVLVEDLAQLLEGRQGDQLPGVLEPHPQDDLAQRGGGERAQGRRQLRVFEQLGQQSTTQPVSNQR